MKQKSDLINKLLNESIESRIEEITKQLGDIQEVDNFDLEVGKEYEFSNDGKNWEKREFNGFYADYSPFECMRFLFSSLGKHPCKFRF